MLLHNNKLLYPVYTATYERFGKPDTGTGAMDNPLYLAPDEVVISDEKVLHNPIYEGALNGTGENDQLPLTKNMAEEERVTINTAPKDISYL